MLAWPNIIFIAGWMQFYTEIILGQPEGMQEVGITPRLGFASSPKINLSRKFFPIIVL
jgi:hypothetical protein